MSKFAKLFDTPNGQFLVFLKPKSEGVTELFTIAEAVGGVVPSLSFDHKDETAEQVFNSYDQGKAEHEAGTLRSMAAMHLREQIK